MKHNFAMIPKAQLPRSSFNMSFPHKTTFDEGLLIPVYCEEILPGDSFNCKTHAFVRLASPLSVPILDNMFFEVQYFFVPNRLVWDNWQKMNGEQKNPKDTTDYLTPVLKPDSVSASWDELTIYDYFGLPIKRVAPEKLPPINTLPLRGYNLIYNEWYRDENLQDSVEVPTADGPDELGVYSLLRRGKRKDYFTGCLPWPQKGPGVELPLGSSAPVIGNGLALGLQSRWAGTDFFGGMTTEFLEGVGGSSLASYTGNYGAPIGMPFSGTSMHVDASAGVTSDPTKSGLVADLSNATAATINSLRQAFQLQKLYERDARGGTRYTEILRAHFGVVSPDARLQRPEYLGGFSQPLIVNPVAQTSSTDGTTPQANLAAYSVVGFSEKGFNKSFVEHGYVIGIASVRCDLSYQENLPRMWSRRGRFDYYWPALAHLGEQAVLNKEIYAQNDDAVDDQGNKINDQVFGYQERWSEYRQRTPMITGRFRSSSTASLDVWHLSQEFNSLPKLNSEFIVQNSPVDRVVQVTNEPHFLADLFFEVKAARVMPTYSVPGLIDHF